MQNLKSSLLLSIIFLTTLSEAVGQLNPTKERIDSIVNTFLTKKEVTHHSFKDTLPLNIAGYDTAAYYYVVDSKTKEILWIKVWYRDEAKTDT